MTASHTGLAVITVLGMLLSGCNAFDRMANIGEKPPLSPIENPLSAPGYRPVSLPMPPPQVAERMPNSLWRAGSRTFCKDLRATRVGDIMTVVINLNESGALANTTTRGRTSTEADSITTLLGFEHMFKHFLSDQATNAPSVNLSTKTSNQGNGTINRTEQINLRLS